MREAPTTIGTEARADPCRPAAERIAGRAPMLFVHFDAPFRAAAGGVTFSRQPDGPFKLHQTRFE